MAENLSHIAHCEWRVRDSAPALVPANLTIQLRGRLSRSICAWAVTIWQAIRNDGFPETRAGQLEWEDWCSAAWLCSAERQAPRRESVHARSLPIGLLVHMLHEADRAKRMHGPA